MDAEFTIYDYLNHQGHNVIRDWLNEAGPGVKARFTILIGLLEATPPGQWTRPVVGSLTGDCEGLFEIRAKVQRVQYRLLGFYGTGRREVTLVVGARKSNNRWVPLSIPDTAQRRKADVTNDPVRFRTVHEF